MMKKILLPLMALLTALIIGGCGMGNPTLSDLSVTDSLYEDKRVLIKLMDELKNKSELKGKDLQVFQSVYISEDMDQNRYIQNLKVTLLKPGTERDVVEYEYSTAKEKKWTGPHPVKVVGGGGDITPNLIAFNDIHFENVSAMYKQTREKAAALKEVTVLVVLLGLNRDLQPYWSVEFTSKNGESTMRGSAKFDMQGNLLNYNPGEQN